MSHVKEFQDRYLDSLEAAEVTHLSIKTLANLRWAGQGPRYYKVRRRILYRLSDLQAWVEQHAVDPSQNPSNRPIQPRPSQLDFLSDSQKENR